MSKIDTDYPMYLTAVKYPFKKHWSFGCNGDLEACVHRLADHAEGYGSNPDCNGRVISFDTGKTVATFESGTGSDGTMNRFCVVCRKTYQEPEQDSPMNHTRICLECKKGMEGGG